MKSQARIDSSMLSLCKSLNEHTKTLQELNKKQQLLRSVYNSFEHYLYEARQKEYQLNLERGSKIERDKIRRLINEANIASTNLWQEMIQNEEQIQQLEDKLESGKYRLVELYEVNNIRI